MAAHEQLVAAAGVPAGLRYALHVPFYPSCNTQYYRPQTTGAPIYMLLGGADTYVGVEPCQTYAEALRAAGARVEVKVFPECQHGFDGGRALGRSRRGENYSQCVFQQQPDSSWIERESGVTTIGSDGKPIQGAYAKALAVCRTLGVSGGLQRCRRQAVDGRSQGLRAPPPAGRLDQLLPRSPSSSRGFISRKATSASSESAATTANAAPQPARDMPPAMSSTTPTISGPTKPPA